MSGPCTDCGGPDYQTLMARIAEVEAELSESRKREWALERARKEDAIDHAGDVSHANALRAQAEAALAERDARWCQNCLSLATCYISAKAMELDDWEEQRVRCGFWAARAEEGSAP